MENRKYTSKSKQSWLDTCREIASGDLTHHPYSHGRHYADYRGPGPTDHKNQTFSIHTSGTAAVAAAAVDILEEGSRVCYLAANGELVLNSMEEVVASLNAKKMAWMTTGAMARERDDTTPKRCPGVAGSCYSGHYYYYSYCDRDCRCCGGCCRSRAETCGLAPGRGPRPVVDHRATVTNHARRGIVAWWRASRGTGDGGGRCHLWENLVQGRQLWDMVLEWR